GAAAVPGRADPVLPGTAWPERVGVDDFQPDRLGAGPVVAGALPDAAGEGGVLGDLGPGVASGVHLVPAPVEVGPVVGRRSVKSVRAARMRSGGTGVSARTCTVAMAGISLELVRT